MLEVIAGAFGFLAAMAAHDLAAQSLHEQPLRPGKGTCPSCGSGRGWHRRGCPGCERPIGREILFLAGGVAGAVAFANTIGATWALVAYAGFLGLSLALVATDLDALRIVDRLNLRGTLVLVIALGAGALADGDLPSYGRALLGGLAYFAGTNLMFIVVRGRGFGYGDVKLSVQLGVFAAYISWGTLGWAVFATAIIGGLLSVGVLIWGGFVVFRSRRRQMPPQEVRMKDVLRREIPYGPSMVAGSWLAIALAGLGAFPIPT